MNEFMGKWRKFMVEGFKEESQQLKEITPNEMSAQAIEKESDSGAFEESIPDVNTDLSVDTDFSADLSEDGEFEPSSEEEFDKLHAVLGANDIPSKILLQDNGQIHVLLGFDYPDDLAFAVYQIADKLGINVEMMADYSGPPPLKFARTNGGPQEYERQYEDEDDDY